MALKKCPKCELNYMKEGETLCDGCKREKQRGVKEKAEEEVIMCTECGEAPAVRGSELCAECLKEQKRQAELESAVELDAAFDEAVADEEPAEEEES